MTLKNAPLNEPESSSPDLFSSVETRAMLQEFRELVRSGVLRVTPENEVLSVEEPSGRSREDDVSLLDKQMLEWIGRRRQQRPEETTRNEAPARPTREPGPAGLRQKVVERLARMVLEIWDRDDESSKAHELLREQVADRLADEILRRWQSGTE